MRRACTVVGHQVGWDGWCLGFFQKEKGPIALVENTRGHVVIVELGLYWIEFTDDAK